MTNHIRGFTLDIRKNNTTHYGQLFYRYIKIPCAPEKWQSRVLRVWVPENFDITKKYGVIYMTDGQNAVDENLTAYGEWNMEDHLHQIKEEGYKDEFIIVGIDCIHNARGRTVEYLPGPCSTFRFPYLKHYYGDKYAEFVVNKIVPYINSHFNVNHNLVGYCGSSMGGLMSFYFCSKYPEIFKFCISFSPAFFFFGKKHIIEQFYSADFKQGCEKYVFFIGGADKLERALKPNTDLLISLLKETGYDDKHLLYMVDESRIHHESTWSDFVVPAIKFILNK